ncbi:MAG: glutamate 5-kinase, partial [Actinomycetales bacterium]|nr:glutamate 5-kinase [Actinomycetales bacterium]
MSTAELRQPDRITSRESLGAARRIVVKIGSSSLTDERGRLSERRIEQIADTAASLAGRGTDLVIVSSGAIAAALGPLGLPERPTEV